MARLSDLTTCSVLAITVLLFGSSVLLLAYSPNSEASPIIEWAPPVIDLTLEQGSDATATVSFTASSDLEDISFDITPSLIPYLEISPNSFRSLTKDEIYTLEIRVAASLDTTVGQFDGTIKLIGVKQQRKHKFFKRFRGWWSKVFWWKGGKDKYENQHSSRPSVVSKPLPITLIVREPVQERIYDPITGASFIPPDNLDVFVFDGYFKIGDEARMVSGYPPNATIIPFNVNFDTNLLSQEEALERIALLNGLVQEDILSSSFQNGGLYVEAQSLTGQHFFLFNPETNIAVEIIFGDTEFYSSEQFYSLLSNLEF